MVGTATNYRDALAQLPFPGSVVDKAIAYFNSVAGGGGGGGSIPALTRTVSAPYAATVTPDASLTDVLNIGTLTGPITIGAPTGSPVDGQTLRIRFVQDGTGGRVVTYNAAFAFGTDITAAMDPTAINSKWQRVFEWNATDSKWRATGLVRGF